MDCAATQDAAPPLASGDVGTLDDATLQAVIGLVRQHTGIAMNERKRVLLEGRLAPRVRALALGSIGQYLERVRAGGAEVQLFINMVTTNDTVFFRTPAVWTYFATQFLPDWQARNPGRCLRIWSAAAASGEEAYSIAMLCHQFAQRHPRFRYQIVGTDIDTAMVAACRAGLYAGRSVQQLAASHPALLERFFARDGERMAVLPELKAHVQFSQHNLLTPLAPLIPLAAGGPFDLVFLRNVLIYFDEASQRTVMANVRRQMHGDARLLLGEQESITRLATSFVFEQQHVYARGAADA